MQHAIFHGHNTNWIYAKLAEDWDEIMGLPMDETCETAQELRGLAKEIVDQIDEDAQARAAWQAARDTAAQVLMGADLTNPRAETPLLCRDGEMQTLIATEDIDWACAGTATDPQWEGQSVDKGWFDHIVMRSSYIAMSDPASTAPRHDFDPVTNTCRRCEMTFGEIAANPGAECLLKADFLAITKGVVGG